MKTLKIEILKQAANEFLRESPNDARDQRNAIHGFVSNLLSKAGAYRGFKYLTESQAATGRSFGIIFDRSIDQNHQYPDSTRIFFF